MTAITYLMGADGGGANGFFANADGYFRQEGSTIVAAPAGGQTLEGVFADLRSKAAAGQIFETINLVSHATGFSSLMFGLDAAHRGGITGRADVTRALLAARAAAAGALNLGAPAITGRTHLALYGCDVGRDAAFIRDVGLLFGAPLDIAAPMHVAVFRRASTGRFEHRLARTWAVSFPSDIETTPAANWPATRTAWVAAASSKFGPIYATRSGDPLGADTMTSRLTTVAQTATTAQAATFFFEERFTVPIPSGQDAQTFVNSVPPQASAVLAPSATDVDDSTVEMKIGPGQITDRRDPRNWIAHIAVLAQVIERPVSLADGTQFRVVELAPATAPATGPRPTGDGGAPPPPAPARSSLFQQGTDAVLAAGGTQDAVDALTAGFVPDRDVDDEPELALADPELPPVETGDDATLDASSFA